MNIFKKIGVKHPIIQGGMANIATAEFAASVTKAGALGLIGTGGWDPKTAEEQIIKMKELVGDLPFGVNVMLMNPHAGDIIDVCIKHQVKVITTGAGNPGKYIEKLKENNVFIIPVVPSLALAKRMEKIGVDAVIVEGTESGGHVGELATMPLVYNTVQNLNIDVIAAGGIASSEQLLAALALGAVGVQIGTILLATKECPIHDMYKQLVIEAKDTSTIVTGRTKGVPVRALKNKMTRTYAKMELQDIDAEQLELLTLGSLRKAVFDGNKDEGSFMAGQVVGSVNEIKTVQEVIEDLVDIQEALNNLTDKTKQL